MGANKYFQRAARFSAFLLLWTCGCLTLTCHLYAQGNAKTIEELDPQTRERYEALRADLEVAREAIQEAEQRAYNEDPMLKKAVEGSQQARDLETEAGRLYFPIQQYYKNKGSHALKAYKRWKSSYSELLDSKWVSNALENPEQREFVLWFVNKMFKESASPKDIPGSELVEDLLPTDLDKLSTEQALDIYLTILQRNRDRNLAPVEELQKAADPPKVAFEYVEMMGNASFLLMLYDSYARLNEPEYIQEKEKRGKEIATQLTQLWPNWGKAEEAVYLKVREEARIKGEALKQPSIKQH